MVSSTSTEQTTSLNTTISLATNYGDTQNPYANKTARYALMAPAAAAGAPGFRYITGADIIGGGINSLINSSTAVGINPAVNGQGNAAFKNASDYGATIEVFIDGFKIAVSQAYANYMFDGINATFIQIFQPQSYGRPYYGGTMYNNNFVWVNNITYAQGDLVRSGTASGYR